LHAHGQTFPLVQVCSTRVKLHDDTKVPLEGAGHVEVVVDGASSIAKVQITSPPGQGRWLSITLITPFLEVNAPGQG